MSIVGRGSMTTLDAPWVVQMEGTLLKRGAGYQKEAAAGSSAATKPRRKLTFLGRKNRTLIRKGAAEKKRFFYLLTMVPDMDTLPRAELRWYTAQKSPEAPPKGAVELNSKMSVQLVGHSTVCLITEGRTFYLRPDKSAGEPSSAAARVTAGKWVHAFEFAINGLRARELAGTSDLAAALHPVTRMSTKLSQEDIEKQRRRMLEAFGEKRHSNASASSALTTATDPASAPAAPKRGSVNTEARAMLQASAEAYAKLWDEFGLHGYNALVAHFGPILIDTKRLEDHFKVRCQLIEAEVSLFDKQTHRSQDVAANEQATMTLVLNSIYKSFERRSGMAQTHLQQLEDEVLAPMRQIRDKIEAELASIVKFHSTTTGNIERLYKGVADLNESIRDLQIAYKTAVPTATRERNKSFMVRGRAKQASPSLDEPAAIAEEIKSSRELLKDCRNALRSEEIKHASRMKLAMRSLHSLEVERLDRQSQCLHKLVELEGVIFAIAERYFDEGSGLMRAINAVDPAADLLATSDRLMQDLRTF